jgi:hypothetical protein
MVARDADLMTLRQKIAKEKPADLADGGLEDLFDLGMALLSIHLKHTPLPPAVKADALRLHRAGEDYRDGKLVAGPHIHEILKLGHTALGKHTDDRSPAEEEVEAFLEQSWKATKVAYEDLWFAKK